MDYHKLKLEHAIDPDFQQLVPAPRGPIPRREVLIKLAEQGKFAAVMALPDLREFLTHPDFATFEIQHPVTQGMINGLVASNVLTNEEAAAINALGTEQVPRWKALGFEREPVETDFTLSPAL